MQADALQVEQRTKFGRWYSPGEFPLPNDEATARMFCTASACLQRVGLEHYEISSYARPGYRQAIETIAFWLSDVCWMWTEQMDLPKSQASRSNL